MNHTITIDIGLANLAWAPAVAAIAWACAWGLVNLVRAECGIRTPKRKD